MRVVIQRVKHASVQVNQETVGVIQQGLLVLVGIEDDDQQEDIDWLAGKVARLRIFGDENGAMNKSVLDIDGEVLSISQFTLFASTKKGNRPSFMRSGHPDYAKSMYEKFNSALALLIQKPIQTGVFAADMQVELLNDGPVTITIDSKNRE